ncbi:MAG TPA: leucyl/phenylalanyl-tRNA--protein transferase [Planctomycetota bacterium]|jgi:leucyl/phenylalanyl-tRNA--protein transferase
MRLTPESILGAYRQGAFPMADPASGSVSWYLPDPRAILPLDTFHVPRRLARALRKFDLTSDRDFEGVIDGCAARPASWISPELRAAYIGLHRAGHAHSVEAWAEGRLAGGIYGVAVGAAFMAESMFHRKTDAGKAALVGLLRHLARRGFELCDIQMVTPATAQFRPIEITGASYLRRLAAAVELDRPWGTFDAPPAPSV